MKKGNGQRLEISAATMDKLQAVARREYQFGVAKLGLNASAEQIDALLAKVCRNYRARCDAALIVAHAASMPTEGIELLNRARELLEVA
jgi:hypothetical protein